MCSQVISIIEDVARTPQYTLMGFSKDRLIYVSNEEGELSLWSCDENGRSRTRLTYTDVLAVAEPSYDDDNIVYSVDVSSGRELQKIYLTKNLGGEENEILEMEPIRVLGISYKEDIIVYAGSSEKEVGLYIGEHDGKAEKLYSGRMIFFVSDFDGDHIVGSGILRGKPRASELFIYDLDNGEFKVYTPKEGSVNGFPKLHDSRILFSSNFEGRTSLYIYDIDDGRLGRASLAYDDHSKYDMPEFINYGWSIDGKIWFIGKVEGRGKAFFDGKELIHPDGTPTNLVDYNENLYISFSSFTTPPSIYSIDPSTGTLREVVASELSEGIKNRLRGTKFIRYDSFDGLKIPCFIIESASPKPGPTVLYVHGGPWSEVADSWNVTIVSLAANGFHVIAPNFRGSTGYGEEFRLLDIGDPGGGDLKDIVYARNYAVDSGLADRVAIMGYSYGGFMTFLATVKEPMLWSCGVAGAGITDWSEVYELGDALFKQFVDMLFDGKRDLWRDRSAIHYIQDLGVPICILHPQNDTRTPLRPILIYVLKLIELGKSFELHVMPDMGHLIRKVDDAIKLLFPSIVFLKRILKT